MKKLFIGILVLAAILMGAQLAGANYFGSTIVKQFDQFEHSDEISTVSISVVKKGLFESVVHTDIVIAPKIPNQDQPANSVTIPLEHVIKHGPFIFGVEGHNPIFPVAAIIHSKLRLSDTDQYISELSKNGNLLSDISIIGINGKGTSTTTVSKIFNESADSTSTFEWSGLNAQSTFTLSKEGKIASFTTNADAGSLAIKDDHQSLSINNVRFDIDLVKHAHKLWSGDMNYLIESVNFNGGAADVSGGIEGLKFAVNSNLEDNEKFNSQLVIDTKKVDIPNFPAQSLSFGVNTGDWDKAGLLAIQKTAEEAQQAGLSPDEQQFAMLDAFQKNAAQLLKHSPYFNIEPIELNGQMGQLKAYARLRVDSKDQTISENVFDLIPMLVADLDFSASKELMLYMLSASMKEQIELQSSFSENPMSEEEKQTMATQLAQQQLDMLLAQGMIVVENDTVKSKITLKESMANMNGQEFPAFDMLQ